LKKIFFNDGTNVGFNLESEAAGASIPDHLHCHIIPRKHGDTGFIQTISDISVITSNMQKIYQQLKETLQ
jgi:ATP adenylyltransferase